MKWTILQILFVLAMLLYLARITIHLRPFKITFETPATAIGVLFLIIAMLLLGYDQRKLGQQDVINILFEKEVPLGAEQSNASGEQ